MRRKEIIADPDEEPRDDPLTRTEEDASVEKWRMGWMGLWGFLLIAGLVVLNMIGREVAAEYHHVLTALIAAFAGVGICSTRQRRRQ
ncbi:hypothetical protein [Nocardia sp. NRRL S-836]|uniref:hypothetical protein n=1 Tax=Nocardia sp. NRRL S-836 TaxID=1519492 RepID=UPI0006AF93EE|nr:hypothetical protein [Nocardia sp. NRRL S-836]KOV85316.1 hypothetical protein ADL03_14285 [Nocardia sp. NRRL S-836]